MFAVIVENIKTIGLCMSAITTCGAGYVYLDMPVPASKNYVIAETATLKSRLIDSQLQTNTMQRNFMRKEKFDREVELQKNPEPTVRSILQNRLDAVNDDLETVNKERESLQKEKAQK